MRSFAKKIFIKIKIIIFFLTNPKYLSGFPPIIFDFVFRKGKRKKERIKSTKICKENSVSTSIALQKILQKEIKIKFRSKFEKEIAESKKLIKETGITLGGAGELDLLYWIVKIKKIRYVLETGVASGWSSLAVLLAQKDIKNSLLISIDMPYAWIKDSYKYVGLAVPLWLRERWILIREMDRKGLPIAFNKKVSFGLVHYDSDKSYYGKKWGLNFIYSKLKKNSIMIIDDIGDNLSFHEFVKDKKLNHLIVSYENKFIGIIMI